MKLKVDDNGYVFVGKLCVAELVCGYDKKFHVYAVYSMWDDLYSADPFNSRRAALKHISNTVTEVFKSALGIK